MSYKISCHLHFWSDYPEAEFNRLVDDTWADLASGESRCLKRMIESKQKPDKPAAADTSYLHDWGQIDGAKVSIFLTINYCPNTEPKMECWLGPKEIMRKLSEGINEDLRPYEISGMIDSTGIEYLDPEDESSPDAL